MVDGKATAAVFSRSDAWERAQGGTVQTMRGIAIAISTWLGAVGWASSSLAQTNDPLLLEESLPYLTVTSDPPGAVVRLSGEYEWVGRTPWSLHRPLSGFYRVEAHAPGYQTWRGELLLGPGEPQDLRIRLSKKTRLGAGLRSLILPGWGQRYNDAPGRGLVYTIGEAAALAGAVVLWEIYQERVDDFDDAARAYRNAETVDSIRETRAVLVEESDDADDAYDRYAVAIGAAAAIYGIAFLDAMFGPKGGEGTESTSTRATQRTAPGVGWHGVLSNQGGAELGLTVRW